MKTRQRLDYNRLAEALGERGLVEPQTLQHILNQSVASGGLFPEILVRENHVSDWELSRVVCEVFGLPYLTTAFYTPSVDASEGIDRAFLHEYALVPLDRYGKLLTVAMPALTPSQVLAALSESAGVEILPLVGSVDGNRSWLEGELPLPNALTGLSVDEDSGEDGHAGVGDFAVSAESLGALEESWGNLFDEGDAAVLLGLDGEIVAGTDADSISELDSIPDLTQFVDEEPAVEPEVAESAQPTDLPNLPKLDD